MLIEFSVENFRSIRHEARLSLDAGPAKERSETHLVVPSLKKKDGSPRPLVRSAAIYGANAAGKSNLIRTLSRSCAGIVLNSSRGAGPIPVMPFLFDSTSREGADDVRRQCSSQEVCATSTDFPQTLNP